MSKWTWTCGGCGVRGRLFDTYASAAYGWEWHREWCDADWASYVIISEEKKTTQTSGGVVY